VSRAAPPVTDGDTPEPVGRDTPQPASRVQRVVGHVRLMSERAAGAASAWTRTRGALDVLVWFGLLAYAFWLTRGLWPHPSTRAVAENVNDQALIEWFLGHGVLVWTGDFSFVSDRLNAPDGINMMTNASHILHGVLMAPVTTVFGPAVSFAILIAVNLAATAGGWYLLLARGLRLHRGAAVIGGFVAGFAPGMISQSQSHLHMTAQWLVPPILWCVIRLTRVTSCRGLVGTSLGLSALLIAQLFLGEEVLYLTALTLALFAVVYAAMRWRWAIEVAPRFLAASALTIGLTLIVVAYPIWVQVAGPMHIPNAPFPASYFYTDLATWWLYSPLSVAGSPAAGRLASTSAEFNAFLGLPILLLLLACVIWRRRSPVVVAAAVAGFLMAYLSLGLTVTVNGEPNGWPSLYEVIADIPLIDAALPTRYALAVIPLIGLIFAVTADAALRQGHTALAQNHTALAQNHAELAQNHAGLRQSRGPAGLIVVLAMVAAVAPTLPRTVSTTERTPLPEFITSGAWRQCVPEGGVLVPVPLPTPRQPDPMRWPAETGAAFAIPEGFFIAPYAAGGNASIGTYKQPTSAMLELVAQTGEVPEITDQLRAQAGYDLSFWRADCVALAHGPNEAALRSTVEGLLGPGTVIADTWTWKVSRQPGG
jgi:hypothetical protein